MFFVNHSRIEQWAPIEDGYSLAKKFQAFPNVININNEWRADSSLPEKNNISFKSFPFATFLINDHLSTQANLVVVKTFCCLVIKCK